MTQSLHPITKWEIQIIKSDAFKTFFTRLSSTSDSNQSDRDIQYEPLNFKADTKSFK
jgi:hypothetical protein